MLLSQNFKFLGKVNDNRLIRLCSVQIYKIHFEIKVMCFEVNRILALLKDQPGIFSKTCLPCLSCFCIRVKELTLVTDA